MKIFLLLFLSINISYGQHKDGVVYNRYLKKKSGPISLQSFVLNGDSAVMIPSYYQLKKGFHVKFPPSIKHVVIKHCAFDMYKAIYANDLLRHAKTISSVFVADCVFWRYGEDKGSYASISNYGMLNTSDPNVIKSGISR